VGLGWSIVVAFIAGVSLGFVAAMLAVTVRHLHARAIATTRAGAPPMEVPAVPKGAAEVLDVLRSSSIVLGADDAILRASPSAHALGLVKRNRLSVDDLLRMARNARRGGKVGQVELDLPRGPLGGNTRPVTARVAPLGADGLVLVLVEDRSEARRINAVRRDFVANVSHELKTPVGALALLAEAVYGASDDPAAVRRFAERMQHEANRLSHLVQEVIDLSRLQSDDPLEKAELVNIDEVIAEALDRCRLAADTKVITLMSGGERGLRVLGDEAQLATALRNLVDNAINYSPEHTRVVVSVRHTGDLVEISVTDQGIGIPKRELERIFERFYRVDPARSRATGGTGLGLSIVKHITANHGGEVAVWSVEGSGSTFTIRLPLGSPLPANGTSNYLSPEREATT
jgi:two-component system sensor histidine kinase SenX3